MSADGAKPKESLLCNSTTDPPPDHISITIRSLVNLDRKFNVPQVYGDTVLLGPRVALPRQLRAGLI